MVAYLAFTGILLALGIDIALPAFDEMRPAIGLDPSSPRITLIITVYFVGMAFGQLFWGPVADRFGRRTTMFVGVGLYVAGAIGAAFAPDLTSMLVVRTIWGLGAAAPAGLRAAIARDLYSGDRMARVMSQMMAIFMVGPILAPLLGELILSVASWQAVFILCAAAGLGQLVWTQRFGETLDPQFAQPLEFASTRRAFARVLSTRATLGYTMAYGFSNAAFFVFLSSTQPIMDRLYGRADQFAVVFGLAGITLAAAFAATNRLVAAFGARRTVVTGALGMLLVAGVHLVVVILADGLPNFWLWLLPVALMNILATPLGPVGITLALDPLGEIAGTAAGVVGFISLLMGSLLAAAIDARITVDVLPMSIGAVVFGSLSIGLIFWVEPRRS